MWRRYVEALELGPELTRRLTDADRVLESARELDNLSLAREAHACTHTTFSPNVIRGGVKTNVIPDRVEIDVDIRALPGVTPEEVDAMLAEALGELAPRVTITHGRAEPGSLSSPDTPLFDSVKRIAEKLLPGSRVVPRLTTGGTDGKFFRWRNIPAYGFGFSLPQRAASVSVASQAASSFCNRWPSSGYSAITFFRSVGSGAFSTAWNVVLP